MIKERKDLEHDLRLIETKNMKITCKNISHGRTRQSPDYAINSKNHEHIQER